MFLFALACAGSFPTAASIAKDLCEAGREAGRQVALLAPGEMAEADALADLKAAGVEVAVLLTDSAAFARDLQSADLLVILLRPGRDAVRSALKLAERSEGERLPFYFLLAHDVGEEAMVASAALALAQRGQVFNQRGTELPKDLWSELWRRAGQIPRLGPRQESDLPPAEERRLHDRWLYRQTATLWKAGQPITCEVREISPGGVAIEVAGDIGPAEELELHLPMIGRFEVEVAHRQGPFLGLRFPLRSAAQNELVSELSRLLEASDPAELPDRHEPERRDKAVAARSDHRTRLVLGLEALLRLAEQRTCLSARLAAIHAQSGRPSPAA